MNDDTERPSIAQLRDEIERLLLVDIKNAKNVGDRSVAVSSYETFKRVAGFL